MPGIEKEYFAFEELQERWGVPHRDLVYLAENGLLKVSVRLYPQDTATPRFARVRRT